MAELPSFGEFAAAKYHRRLLVVGLCSAPALWFLGERGALVAGHLMGSRRLSFGIAPEYLRIAAPVAWVVAFGVASWVVSWRAGFAKHVYRAASACALVMGLASAALAGYATTTKLNDGSCIIWLIASLVAAALGAGALFTARKRMDWQLYGIS